MLKYLKCTIIIRLHLEFISDQFENANPSDVVDFKISDAPENIISQRSTMISVIKRILHSNCTSFCLADIARLQSLKLKRSGLDIVFASHEQKIEQFRIENKRLFLPELVEN